MQASHVAKNFRHHGSRHAVAGVNGHAQFLGATFRFIVEQSQQVRLVLRPHIAAFAATTTRLALFFFNKRGEALDINQASLLSNRLCVRAADFKPVVIGGIVAGGDLNSTSAPKMIDGEIHNRRIHHSNINHIGAVILHALRQRVRQRRTALAHVAAHDNVAHHGIVMASRRGLLQQKFRGAVANMPRQFFIERLWIGCAHVVGFEHFCKHGILQIEVLRGNPSR